MPRSKKTSSIKVEKLICPCCEKVRHPDSLIGMEEQIQQLGAMNWGQYSEGWSIELATAGYLQWACSTCLKLGRAIAAKPWLQFTGMNLPYFAYYDVKGWCKDCRTTFIFSASEQQFWYEELKFYVLSRPAQCLDCRRKRREHKNHLIDLEAALHKLDPKNPEQLLTIAELYLQIGSTEKALEFFRRAKNRSTDATAIETLTKQIELLLKQ